VHVFNESAVTGSTVLELNSAESYHLNSSTRSELTVALIPFNDW
jgi:hypothetical protein